MEIAEIAEGVQLLIAETDRGVPEVSLAGLSESAQQLREVSKESNPLDESEKEILLNVANKIDQTVKGLTAAEQKAIMDESEQS
jgi:ribosomal protein S15P/S13E